MCEGLIDNTRARALYIYIRDLSTSPEKPRRTLSIRENVVCLILHPFLHSPCLACARPNEDKHIYTRARIVIYYFIRDYLRSLSAVFII